GGPLVPKSLLNGLRRELVARLDEEATRVPSRTLAADPVLPALRAPLVADQGADGRPPTLSVLCRNTAQIEGALAEGVETIYADYQHIKEYKEAVAAVRRTSAALFIATPRIEKPFEANLFRFLGKQGADGILVRNAGGLAYFAGQGIPFVADFS